MSMAQNNKELQMARFNARVNVDMVIELDTDDFEVDGDKNFACYEYFKSFPDNDSFVEDAMNKAISVTKSIKVARERKKAA